MRDIRLGDDIDDFCVRCKRVMNHAVVSVMNAAPAKVRCRTCHSDHDFRHEQPPPPKVDPRKAALGDVLKKVSPDDAVKVAEDEDAIEGVELEEVETVEVAEEPAAAVVEKPKAKAKAKAKGKK